MTYSLLVSDRSRPSGAGDIPTVARERLAEIDSSEVAYWLVEARDGAGSAELGAVRQNPAPQVYLKPVVLLTGDDPVSPLDLRQADLHLSGEQLREGLPPGEAARFQAINRYVAGLPGAAGGTDTNLAFRLLRFLASRDQELTALMTDRHRTGFVYPLLLPFFAEQDDGFLRVLEFLEHQRLVRGEFQSKAHFCHHCGCAFLNFLETCPHCASADLRLDEMVHHFKCAHTAPMSDFQRDEALVCPKCTRTLRHIGVDYDKPSIVYTCNQCSHSFQDPTVSTVCYHCGRAADPEHQQHREIKRFTVTAIGKNTAMYGLDTLFTSLLESELNLQPYDAFARFVQVEKARIERYHVSNSSLLMVSLADLDQVYLEAGARAKEIFGELGRLFRGVLRDSDVLTARSESVFVILLTETGPDQAQRALERLAARVGELLETNLGRQPEIRSAVYPVGGALDLDASVEQFLKDHAG